MNAMGQNALDGYLYAMGGAILALAAGLVRIDAAGTMTEVDPNPPRSLLLGTYDIGDVDDQGQYWATNAGIDWIQYDLNPTSATYGQVASFGAINLLNLLTLSIGDWSYVASGGALFAVGNVAANTALFKFDRATKTITKVAEYTGLGSPSFTTILGLARAPAWSATYSGQTFVYASESVSGQIWRFPVNGGAPTRQSATGPTGNADGARCFSSPNV